MATIFNTIRQTVNSIINAITSYINIFITETPLNIPSILKNGKCLYKYTEIGFLNKNDNEEERYNLKLKLNAQRTKDYENDRHKT